MVIPGGIMSMFPRRIKFDFQLISDYMTRRRGLVGSVYAHSGADVFVRHLQYLCIRSRKIRLYFTDFTLAEVAWWAL